MIFDVKYMHDALDIYRFNPANPGWVGYTYGYANIGYFTDMSAVFEFIASDEGQKRYDL